MSQARTKPMTLAQFLDWEERQEVRHEFADGAVTMMSGGTDAHDEVRGAIHATLRAKLRTKESPCRARLDLKLVCPNGRSRYPDVAVICGPRDPKATRLTDPVVLVEVLSPSTRATDYMVKSVDYASVASVAVYLIVDPDEPRIDVLRRDDGALRPQMQLDSLNAVIDLPEIGVALTLAEIYDVVT
jgi:Uma2 family endonuclease